MKYLSLLFIVVLVFAGCDPPRNSAPNANRSNINAATLKSALSSPTAEVSPKPQSSVRIPSNLKVSSDPDSTKLEPPVKKQKTTKIVEDEIDNSGASAKCRDESLSYSAHRRGTCSHHGGVAVWY